MERYIKPEIKFVRTEQEILLYTASLKVDNSKTIDDESEILANEQTFDSVWDEE